MKLTRKILAAGLAAAIALPAVAVAQTALPDTGVSQQAGERAERAEERTERRGGHRGGGLWNTAERLTAAETALAITDEQQPAWRNFAAAAVAFAETGPLRGPRGERESASNVEAASGQRTLNDLRAVRVLDRVIERGGSRTASAQELREAINGLSAVLTPEQVETADRLLSELRPGRGGPRGGGRSGG